MRSGEFAEDDHVYSGGNVYESDVEFGIVGNSGSAGGCGGERDREREE
jgi:hypothetical protein